MVIDLTYACSMGCTHFQILKERDPLGYALFMS